MYKISIKNTYLSINKLDYELPNFVVLTGINGSGKTQLLQVMENTSVTDIFDGEMHLYQRKLIPVSSLSPNSVPEAMLPNPRLDDANRFFQDNYGHAKQPMGKAHMRMQFEDRFNSRDLFKVKHVAKYSGKDTDQLELKDFQKHLPVYDANPTNDFLAQSFDHIFRNYFRKYYANEIRKAWDKSKNTEKTHLTLEEFEEKYGNPRKLINDVIKKLNLEYEFNEINDPDEEATFVARLINKKTGNEITMDGLSSGEKVIMSLVFAIYNSTFNFQFPQILLLDEPDASLHPSMTKQFLGVVENVFVNELGIKVIMTTHSPSTVALVPEESLYVMNKVEPRIEKTTKDEALGILLEGVPSLSINYENRRQIFVESANDVFFYEELYKKLRSHLIPEISLNFISSGIGNTGNCAQVIKVVDKLANEFGNKNIFGIIDWDTKNQENHNIKVLGEDKRYSIENYIFDPILLAAFLLREKILKREDLKLNNSETFADFKNLSTERLQEISNYILDKVNPFVEPANKVDETEIFVEYLSGIEIKIQNWYLIHPGHELEDNLKKAFPQLNKFNNEGVLKKEIINKVVDDIPDLIPLDIFHLLESIQK